MTTTTMAQVFRVKAYDLECSARAIDGGRFAPVLVATRHAWPSRPRTIDVARGNHADEESAVAAARSKGIEWIACFG